MLLLSSMFLRHHDRRTLVFVEKWAVALIASIIARKPLARRREAMCAAARSWRRAAPCVCVVARVCSARWRSFIPSEAPG